MTCTNCGYQLQGEAPCARCGAWRRPDDQGFVDPYSGVDWGAPEAQQSAPAVASSSGPKPLLIGLLVLACVAVVGIGVVVWALVGRGAGPNAATPAPVMSSTEAALPEVTQAPVASEPAVEVTVYATVTAAPEPASGETMTSETAIRGVERYFATVAGNPTAGWQLLTPRRQQIEDEAAYHDFWGQVSSATVSGCSFDPGTSSIECDLTTTTAAAKSSTTSTRLWLAEEAGVVRIDVAGGEGEDQLAAEEELERLRQRSLAGLALDGRWIVELSAKRPGITDPLQVAANGSHTFYLTDILAVHDDLVQRMPDVDVLQLRRADWGKQGRDLWFTIADPGGLASKEGAEAWCAQRFPELAGEELANQCVPRELRPPYSS